MAVFISYSHSDSEFVDALAGNLFRAKANVWVDRWELNVGESLIRRIEEAVTKAAAIVFVLSKASVDSEWCRKELTAALVRELEEKKVLVLPALLEDCAVPLFLREKKYADFRTSFDSGLRDLTNALARVTADTQNRLEDPQGHIDWSLDWSLDSDGNVTVQVAVVEQVREAPFTTLSVVDIHLNPRASARHRDLARAGFELFGRQLVLGTLADSPLCDDLYVYMEDAAPVERVFGLGDPKVGLEFSCRAVCRRMGTDTGKDIVLDLGRQLRALARQTLEVLERTRSPERTEELRRIMRTYRPDFPTT